MSITGLNVNYSPSLAGKESACNAEDPGSVPGLGRSPGERIGYPLKVFLGFPGGSDSKESTCNAGDLGSIPGLGRFPGGGDGNPFQYSWAFLVAELVKNPPAMRETWVRSLDWEDPQRRERLPTQVF